MMKHKNNKKKSVNSLKTVVTVFVLLVNTFIFIFSSVPSEAETYGFHTWVYPDDGEVISINLLPSKTMRTPISKLHFGVDNFAYAFCTDIHHPLIQPGRTVTGRVPPNDLAPCVHHRALNRFLGVVHVTEISTGQAHQPWPQVFTALIEQR